MIEMNRVSQLLHKARFVPRQRRSIAFFRRYVISTRDIAKQENVEKQVDQDPRATTILTDQLYLDDLMSGFDPQNDYFDRRVFFEVTGKSLMADEFEDDNSSNEDERDQELNDPQHWVFSSMEGSYDGKDDAQDQLLPVTQTIN